MIDSQKAYVERLNGSFLFDSMYNEDPEGQKLLKLPGMEETLNVSDNNTNKLTLILN